MDGPWLKHRPWQNPISSIRRTGSFSRLSQVFGRSRASSGDYSTLELDPHPGSIGGRVSGTIRIPPVTKIDSACLLRLSCIFSVPTRADDYSDDDSEVLWSHTQPVDPRVTRHGVEVRFSFEGIPDDLPESQLPLAGHFVDWQLTLTSSSDGNKLSHTFSVPVFVSDLYGDRPLTSASDSEALISTWSLRNTWRPYRAEIKTIGDSLIIRLGPRRGGMFQTGGWGGLVAIVLTFLLSLTLLVFANHELVSIVVTGVFGTLGLFVTGLAAYLWIRVVEIRVRPGWLSLDCFILGRTVKSRILSAEEITGLEIRFSQLFVVSTEHGWLELMDSIHDLRLLNALRRLIRAYLVPG